ncbi:hypothetical protein FZ983_20520 [Azospirillum sp. B21]|uniref:hypothetical protein n=1 Tax=Azospirillum sp. B21 TaxID=2607496 RepID=UPI0011EC154E|nr:hypothetical protein [Azospirillum sp. B21]KAA0577960.1 hypothetical protein FZ983_20520 [Azospirillum sp. B21]
MAVIDIVLDLPDRRPRILLDLDDSHSNERTITGWIQGGRFYEPDVSLALTRLVREGDCAVDIGANAGFFTILLGALTGPGGCCRWSRKLYVGAALHKFGLEQVNTPSLR